MCEPFCFSIPNYMHTQQSGSQKPLAFIFSVIEKNQGRKEPHQCLQTVSNDSKKKMVEFPLVLNCLSFRVIYIQFTYGFYHL